MAFCVHVVRKGEDNEYVFYSYADAADKSEGIVKINKETGDVSEVQLSDDDKSGSKAQRAFWALLRCWVRGELPVETWWES